MLSDFHSVRLIDQLLSDQSEAWRRLDSAYLPLIRSWLRNMGVEASHAEDVAQESMVVVWRKLRSFQRNREGSFRCWIRSIVSNCLRDYCRKNRRHAAASGGDDARAQLDALAAPQNGASCLADDAETIGVFQIAMRQVERQFSEPTWRAFVATALQCRKPTEVAAELGLSENAVCIAKSRVTARIREVAQEHLKR